MKFTTEQLKELQDIDILRMYITVMSKELDEE